MSKCAFLCLFYFGMVFLFFKRHNAVIIRLQFTGLMCFYWYKHIFLFVIIFFTISICSGARPWVQPAAWDPHGRVWRREVPDPARPGREPHVHGAGAALQTSTGTKIYQPMNIKANFRYVKTNTRKTIRILKYIIDSFYLPIETIQKVYKCCHS